MQPQPTASRAADAKHSLTLRRHVPEARLRELFACSGYLGLREGNALSPAWLQLDADEVSQDLVYLGGDGVPVGHVSVSRAYGTTWLGHQIAMRRDHPEQMQARASLYDAFARLPIERDGEEARLLGYFDPTLRWHQRFFTDFADSVPEDLAAVVPWDRFEREIDAPLPEEPDFDGVIEPLRSRDVVSASAIARRQLPRLLNEALAISPPTLLSPHLHPGYPRAGIDRSRSAFVLRQSDRVVAVGLCELTDPSMSVFNLMNLAHVFATPEACERGLLALQNRIRRFYLGRGIRDPLLVAPAGRFDASSDPAVRLEETMGCIVWSAAGLRAYRTFLRDQFSRTEER